MLRAAETKRRTIRRAAAGLIGLLVMVAGARLWLVARPLATAPGVLSVLLQDSTLGWIGRGHEHVWQLPPERQAEFWIAESERILSEQSTSELARGAAWMLNSPADGISVGFWQQSRNPRLWRRYSDDRAQDRFEAQAAERCFELGRLATELAPDDPQAWRTRAAMKFQVHALDWRRAILLEPRGADWMPLLDEAARQEPDNALYDYMATVLTGNTDYFELGRHKPILRGAEYDSQLVLDFLARSSVPKYEHPQLLSSRRLPGVREQVISGLVQLKRSRAAELPPREKFAELMACFGIMEQLAPLPDGGYAYASDTWLMDPANQLLRLTIGEREQLSQQDATELQEQMIATRARRLLLQSACDEAAGMRAGTSPPSLVDIFTALAVSTGLAASVLLGALGLAAWGACAALASRQPPGATGEPRMWSALTINALAWPAAIGATFVALGLAPARMIDVTIQRWAALILVGALPAVALVAGLVAIFRARKWRLGSPMLLLAVPLLGALVTLVRQPMLEAMIRISRSFEIRPRLIDGVHFYYVWRVVPELDENTIPLAVVQWVLYHGPAVTIGLALGMVFLAYWLVCGRRRGDDGQPVSRRTRWQVALRAVARSAFGMAIVLLLVSLLLAPALVANCQTTYEEQMAQFHFLPQDLDRIAAEVRRIEADGQRMGELRTWAEQQLFPDARP